MTVHTVVGAPVGMVRGTIDEGVRRFSGIPFATASRFRRPREVAWEGEMDATRWGPAPWQPLPAFDDPGAPFSEDCLNVAVWAPAEQTGPLPVLVWIYGGGFEYGSNASPLTRGDALARGGDMIVVALNYRIGALGWAQLAHLGGQLSEASNLGLHDLVAGLRWVRDNIGAFGGDPDRVTLMGESAGSFAGSALLAVPAAVSLYASFAAFSGCTSRIVPMDSAVDLGEAILGELQTDPMTASPAEWIAAQSRAGSRDLGRRNAARSRALGVVDDSAETSGLLVGHPLTAVEAGVWGERRMVVGTMRDEAAMFPEPEFDDLDTLTSDVARWIDSDHAGRIVAAYAADAPGLLSIRRRVLTDWIYRLPAVRLADAVAETGGTAYLSTVGRVDGAPAAHGYDVPGLFGRHAPDATPAAMTRDREITRLVRTLVGGGEPFEPTGRHGATRAASLGEPGYDAGEEYRRVRERWAGVPRP